MNEAKDNAPARNDSPPAWLYLLLVVVVAAILAFALTRSQDRVHVSLEEAKKHYDAGTAIFLDVRSPQQYRSAHIPGAALIPLGEVAARYGELPPEARILVY